MRYSIAETVIEIAMLDYLENGTLTPHNPAICRDSRGWYYGSALHGDSVFDLAYGFGSWTPATIADVEACATGLAATIVQ